MFLFSYKDQKKILIAKNTFKFYYICVGCGDRQGQSHKIFDKIKQMKEHILDSQVSWSVFSAQIKCHRSLGLLSP